MKKINYGGSSKILNGIVTKINAIIDSMVVDVKVNDVSVVDENHVANIDLTLADQNVKQSPTTDDADYRILLSKSANDTEETDISRKNTNFKYNPSTGNLQVSKVNGNTVPSGSGTVAMLSDIPDELADLTDDSTHRVVTDEEKATWNDKRAVNLELTNEDLDDVKTVGFYVGKSGNTCTNKPSSDIRQFGLIVVKTATSGNYYNQTFIRPNAQGETWTRNCVNGIWTTWKKELSEEAVKWSEQNLLGAKNIIPYPYREMTVEKNGITFTVNSDYSVNVSSGSPSANTNWYYCYRATWKAGTYILSGYADTEQGNNFCLRAVINQDLSGSRTYNDYGEGVEVTVNDGEVLSIYLHMSASGVSSNKNHYVMIRPSTVADATYQEPTLTNRQLTLNKLSWEENKLIGVKNYFTYPFYPHPLGNEVYPKYEVEWTDNGDGSITANGTSQGGTAYCQLMSTSTFYQFTKLPPGRYHFSGGISSDYYMNLSTVAESTPSGNRTMIDYDYGNGFDFEVTEAQSKNNIFCSFAFVLSGKTADNVVFYPSITRYEDNSDGFVKYAPTNQVLAEIKADKLGTYLHSEDLNDLTYPGFYIGRNDNTCINKPSGFNQFGLIVVRTATSGSYYKQILIRPNANGETLSRTCTNGVWSAWKQEIFTDENVKQSPLGSTNSDYPLLMAYSANGTEETKVVWKDTNITYNPSTSTFNVNNGTVKAYTGQYSELVSTFIGFMSGSTLLAYFSPNPNQITTPTEIGLPITSGVMALEEWQNRIGSMNLLPQKTTHKSGRVSSGATFTVNLDGTITVNRTTTSGTATFDLTSSSINGGMWLPNGTYYVKGCPQGGSTSTSSGYQLGVRCQKNNATYQIVNEAGDGATFTVDGDDFSSDGAWVRVVIILRANVSATNMLWKPMITLTSLSNRNTYYPPSMSNRQLTFEKMDSVNVATIENTDNASKAYTVNDYMVLRGQLYRVTQAISNGGAITIGTNVTATTVGAELKAIRNALNL